MLHRKRHFHRVSPRQLYRRIPLFLLISLLLTTGCAALGSETNSKSGNTRVLLAPLAGTIPPSSAEMEQTRQILDRRISDMGLNETGSQVLTRNGLSIQIDLSPFD